MKRGASSMRLPPWLAALALLPLVLALGCGEPQASFPHADLMLRVTAKPDIAATGAPVTLEVVRTWSRSWIPRPFDDGAFAPLVLKPLDRVVRREDAYTQETLRFRAHVFALDDVMLRSPRFAATHVDGTKKRIAKAPPVLIRVRSGLPPDESGTPELPREGLGSPPARSRIGLLVRLSGLLALAVLVVAVARARRRRGLSTDAAPPTQPPTLHRVRDTARQLLDAIPTSRNTRAAALQQLGAVLRTGLTASLGLDTAPLTAKECVQALPRAEPVQPFLELRERLVYGAWHPTEHEAHAAVQALLAGIDAMEAGA